MYRSTCSTIYYIQHFICSQPLCIHSNILFCYSWFFASFPRCMLNCKDKCQCVYTRSHYTSRHTKPCSHLKQTYTLLVWFTCGTITQHFFHVIYNTQTLQYQLKHNSTHTTTLASHIANSFSFFQHTIFP